MCLSVSSGRGISPIRPICPIPRVDVRPVTNAKDLLRPLLSVGLPLALLVVACSGCSLTGRLTGGRQQAAAGAVPLRFEILAGVNAGENAGTGPRRADDESPGAPAALDARPPQPIEYVHVHVAGAVLRPGVYRLVAGARACDALALAGGETPQAHLAAINLASLLSDGEQLYIPTLSEVKASGSVAWHGGSWPPGTAGGAAGSGVSTAPSLVDVNMATASALESLPGIGPVLAERIIAFRVTNGRFASVDDLLKVSGIGPQKLADIRSRVTVR